MRFYLAASAIAQGHMKSYRHMLVEHGHMVTSRWIDVPNMLSEDAMITSDSPLGFHLRGKDDLEDIIKAEAMLLFTQWPSTTGGYHVEFGVAIAMKKPVYIIGPYRNVFHGHAAMRFQDWNEFQHKFLSALGVFGHAVRQSSPSQHL